MSHQQRLNKLEKLVSSIVPVLKQQRDSILVFSGALKVLQDKGLVTNEDIKKAIEEAVAGKSSVGPSAASSGEPDNQLSNSAESGDAVATQS
jgi:hypothetical protein